MVFSSHLFLFYFLPAVLLLYYLMPQRVRHLMLTAFSYVFYGWANPYFMPLMLLCTAIAYGCGLVIAQRFGWEKSKHIELLVPGGPRSRAQKGALLVAVVSHLAMLGFFKYFNFGIENYNACEYRVLIYSFG